MPAHQYIAYHADSKNLYGALLFLGYIVAALVFSLRATLRIYRQTKEHRSGRSFKLRAFTVFAVLCFSVLSWNMLSFLILSWTDYTSRHKLHPTFTKPHLWDWMYHSALFEDFAHALVSPVEAWWWTQLALLVSYVILLWLAKTFRVRRLDGLGDLFVISQILPISFTLSLAFLTLLTAKGPPPGKGFTQKKVVSSSQGSGASTMVQVAIAGAFLCALATVPNLSGPAKSHNPLSTQSANPKPALVPLVLFIRMLMASSYFTQDGQSENTLPIALLIVAGAALQLKDTLSLSMSSTNGSTTARLVDVLLSGHPSPRTLGQDAVLAILSAVAWIAL